MVVRPRATTLDSHHAQTLLDGGRPVAVQDHTAATDTPSQLTMTQGATGHLPVMIVLLLYHLGILLPLRIEGRITRIRTVADRTPRLDVQKHLMTFVMIRDPRLENPNASLVAHRRQESIHPPPLVSPVQQAQLLPPDSSMAGSTL